MYSIFMELSKLVDKLLFKHSYINLNDFDKGGIYLIKSTKSNNVYVGKTYKSFIKRLLEHQYSILKGISRNRHMMRAVHKYGISTFEVHVIEFLPNELQKIAKEIKNHKKYELQHPDEFEKLNTWLNEKEIYWIAYYRKIGNVYNQNDGGNGGLNPDKDVRYRMSKGISKSMKRYYAANPKAHERLSKQSKAYMSIPENRQHQSIKAKERFKNPKERKKISISGKKRFENPNEHIKISNGLKHYYATNPNALEQNRKSSIEMWKNPEKRANIINGLKNRFKKPGELEKHGERSKNYWKNKEYRNKVITSINLPEVKKMKGKHISQTKQKLSERNKNIMKSLLEPMFLLKPVFETLSLPAKWDMFYDILRIIESDKITKFDVNNAYIMLEKYSHIFNYRRYRYPNKNKKWNI